MKAGTLASRIRCSADSRSFVVLTLLIHPRQEAKMQSHPNRDDPMPKKKSNKPTHLPSGAGVLAQRFPNVWESYAALGERCAEAGPLDPKTRHLVKIALAAGASSEGAVHSHVRRGLAEGLTKEEIRHVALLAIPTLGLPGAVRTMTWMDDLLEDSSKRRR
jgi:alkylhydroperoxidase/carboxymuconolactone decarboxylase family protein YurZ